ncbi:uncharacterized protein BKA78DRAFT_69154 [Phyllosticta capitalensis]|uniref:uncharacterized protein n=1 Tax=Phyllosticta capitalensis TaxID=121624 RepID=UPI00312F80B6
MPFWTRAWTSKKKHGFEPLSPIVAANLDSRDPCCAWRLLEISNDWTTGRCRCLQRIRTWRRASPFDFCSGWVGITLRAGSCQTVESDTATTTSRRVITSLGLGAQGAFKGRGTSNAPSFRSEAYECSQDYPEGSWKCHFFCQPVCLPMSSSASNVTKYQNHLGRGRQLVLRQTAPTP